MTALVKAGHSVVTIDNFSTGFRGQIPGGVEVIEGNCYEELVIKKLSGIKLDAIMHIAGQSSGEVSFDDPVYDLQTNVQSTVMLMKHALSIGCRKFIYASSMSVYGDQKNQPVDEHAFPSPQSFYAIGKLASEKYMRIYNDLGLATTSLRLFNVYGPGQNLQNLRQGMVSIFLRQALAKKHIQVKGSAERYRDHVYIDDVVHAFLAAVDQSESKHRIFNIGTGVKTSVEELIKIICDRLPYNVEVEYEGSTPGDMLGIYANTDLIKNTLNWEARVSLESGIDRMVNWARTQEN